MNDREAEDFAREELLEEGETLRRAQATGPFVVALVELPVGGYQNRAGQPAVILRGRRSGIPAVTVISTHGRSAYPQAARRFNSLVDRELA